MKKKIAFGTLLIFVALWLTQAGISLFTASSYSPISADNKMFSDSIALPDGAKVEYCYGIGRAETAGKLVVTDAKNSPQMVEGMIVWNSPGNVRFVKVLHEGKYIEFVTSAPEGVQTLEDRYTSYIDKYFDSYGLPDYKVEGAWDKIKYYCSGAITRRSPVYYYVARTNQYDNKKQAEAEIAYSYAYYSLKK